MQILTVKDLTLAYGENTVLSGANFALAEGDFVCVVGANGSGKSTLIKGILGLIRPVQGQIKYGAGLTQTAIGYLPQETRVEANFPATVQEIVLSGNLGRMGHRPFYGAAERAAAERSLQRLMIADLAGQSFAKLSGGQRQKVLLARALTATTRLLILDEPSNNLDHASRQEFYRMLKTLNSQQGLTIMMITHDLDADDLIGNKVLALKDGRVTLASTAEYLRSFK